MHGGLGCGKPLIHPPRRLKVAGDPDQLGAAEDELMRELVMFDVAEVSVERAAAILKKCLSDPCNP
jgi:hypothetical protein